VPDPPWTGASGMDNRPSGHGGILTGGGHKPRGEGGEPITTLTQAWDAAMWSGDGGEEAVAVALSGGDARAWRGEKKSGVRCGGGRRGSPFCRGWRGRGGREERWRPSS
jgi:hypothetical protein